MKNERTFIFSTLLTFVTSLAFSQEMKVANEGLLIPRMTYAQRNEILNPTAGLVIWCTDCDELQVYNGMMWKNLGGRASSPPSPPYVTICEKDWMIKNLDVSVYRNGDPIPQVTDPKEWASLTTGAYCYYNNDSTLYADIYGKLYNWYALNDPRGLGPEGWRVPRETEWVNCLGSSAGRKMKAESSLWSSLDSGATNTSGFSGFPGGVRNSDGTFDGIGFSGHWWTSTELRIDGRYDYYFPENAKYKVINHNLDRLDAASAHKSTGHSVRCIRD